MIYCEYAVQPYKKINEQNKHFLTVWSVKMSFRQSERLLQQALRLKGKLRDATSTPPAFWPVWTGGQTLNFKRSWSWNDASQITSSSSAIFLFHAVSLLVACRFASWSSSFPLWHSAIRCDTPKAQMTAGEDKVTQSPTFNGGYPQLCLTGLRCAFEHTSYALNTHCAHACTFTHTQT